MFFRSIPLHTFTTRADRVRFCSSPSQAMQSLAYSLLSIDIIARPHTTYPAGHPTAVHARQQLRVQCGCWRKQALSGQDCRRHCGKQALCAFKVVRVQPIVLSFRATRTFGWWRSILPWGTCEPGSRVCTQQPDCCVIVLYDIVFARWLCCNSEVCGTSLCRSGELRTKTAFVCSS